MASQLETVLELCEKIDRIHRAQEGLLFDADRYVKPEEWEAFVSMQLEENCKQLRVKLQEVSGFKSAQKPTGFKEGD